MRVKRVILVYAGASLLFKFDSSRSFKNSYLRGRDTYSFDVVLYTVVFQRFLEKSKANNSDMFKYLYISGF